MHFGLELGGYWPHHRHHIDNMYPEMIESVKVAEQIGIENFLIGEHHFMDYGATPDPMSLAAYVAAITKTPRIILAVLILPIHDVQRLAGEIAQLDQLTRGRIDLGFGRGGAPYELLRFNAPSDYETSRIIFEERMKAMKILFTQQDVSLDWDTVKLKNITIMPPIYQKPMPPMWQMAMRPESCFHVAKAGFHVSTGQLRQPMSFCKEMIDAFREGAAQSGRPAGEQRISMLQWTYVARDKADRDAKIDLAYRKQQQFVGMLTNKSDTHGGIVRGIEIEGTPEDYASTIVIGERNYVLDRMLAFKELGFDDFMMKLQCGPDHTDVMATMDVLGRDIMPAVKAA